MIKKKKFQLWINHNYESTRFWTGMATAIIIIFVLLGQNKALNEAIDLNRKVTESQSQQVKGIIEELKDDNERQTQLISCLLAIHGEASTIAPEDQVKCRADAAQQIENSRNDVDSSGDPLPSEPQSSNQTPPPTSSGEGGTDESPEPTLFDQAGKAIGDTTRRVINWFDQLP